MEQTDMDKAKAAADLAVTALPAVLAIMDRLVALIERLHQDKPKAG